MIRSSSAVASATVRYGLACALRSRYRSGISLRQSFDRRKIAAQTTEFSQYLS
jgi:hypothetical protein